MPVYDHHDMGYLVPTLQRLQEVEQLTNSVRRLAPISSIDNPDVEFGLVAL